MADFNFLVHLQQNHTRYGLQSWEITSLGENVSKGNVKGIALFRAVLESCVGVGLRCPICESKGHESGTFTTKSFFNHVREFHSRNAQTRGLKLQCPICASDPKKAPHERLKLHNAPLHTHLEKAHGFQSVGRSNHNNSGFTNTSTIPCRWFAQGYCRDGSSCRYSHARSTTPTTTATTTTTTTRPTTPVSGSGTWEFDNGGGQWIKYPHTDNRSVENAFKAYRNRGGSSTYSFRFSGTRYVVHFSTMEQENTMSRNRRLIRRRVLGGSSSSSSSAQPPRDPKVTQLLQLVPFKTIPEIQRALRQANGDIQRAATALLGG